MRKLVAIAAPPLLFLFFLAVPLRAEVIEEIVAWVNGEVITLSDYREEEEGMVAEAYRRFSGDELDRQLEQLRKALLLRLIDRKILVDAAQQLYDMTKMGDVFLKGFKEQQSISSDAELQRLLEQEGMSLEDLKLKLLEMFAPEEVIRFEVTSRVFVSNDEIESFYKDHSDKFVVLAEATLREIVVRADETAARPARRAAADKIRERLLAGEDFAEVAREVSEAGTREEGGLLGTLKINELSDVLRGPAASLPIGAVSEVLETPHGFHIIRVESRTEDHIQPLEEIREQLKRHLQERKEATEITAFLDKARADSEWCVKSKFEKLLSIPAPGPCQPE